MSEPTISVLMPVYNCAAYLDEAIWSIRSQSFTNFEFVIVDDGSKDRSAEICRRHACEDARLVILSQENRGQVAAMNAGLAVCRGEFIARMDSDDIALPERLKLQHRWMIEHPECVAVGCQVQLIDADGRYIGRGVHPESHDDIDATSMSGTGGAICHPAFFLRAETIRQLGGYGRSYQFSEDLDLLLRMAEVGKLANCPEILLRYRIHPLQISTSFNFVQTVAAIRALNGAATRRHTQVKAALSTRWSHASWQASDSGHRFKGLRYAAEAVCAAPLCGRAWKSLVRAVMSPFRRASSAI